MKITTLIEHLIPCDEWDRSRHLTIFILYTLYEVQSWVEEAELYIE